MTDPPKPRASRRTKIAAVVVVIVLLVIAQRLGVFQQFKDPAVVRETLVRLGPWGYVAFIVAFALLQPFGVPGTVFVFAAPLIWPWPVAYGLSMAGSMAASVIGFSFTRFVARDWIVDTIPARFRKYEGALERRALTTVFTLRLIFWMPQVLHAFFGVSKVRFWTHFWGSLAGYALPLFVMSFFGEKLYEIMRQAPSEVWMALGAGLVTIAVGVLVIRRRRQARDA